RSAASASGVTCATAPGPRPTTTTLPLLRILLLMIDSRHHDDEMRWKEDHVPACHRVGRGPAGSLRGKAAHAGGQMLVLRGRGCRDRRMSQQQHRNERSPWGNQRGVPTRIDKRAGGGT